MSLKARSLVSAEKSLFVVDLVVGRTYEIQLMVISQKRLTAKNGKPYLNLVFGDRTGRIPAKVWDAVDQLEPLLAVGQVASIRGEVSLYDGAPQLTVRSVGPLNQSSIILDDFAPAAKRDLEELTQEFTSLVDQIKDPDYRRLVVAVFKSPKVGDFWRSPAAKSFHHSYVRGLLEHTVTVGHLAAFVAKLYAPCLCGDLLLAGALLHDVGKCWEFSQGLATDYTTAGRFLGHLQMGAMFLGEVAADLGDFPEDKLLLLRHLLVSHHGEPAFGSPQKPKILEAIALHQLDDLDGKLNGVGDFIREDLSKRQLGPGNWTAYHKLLGDYFYALPGVPLWGEAEGQSPAAPTQTPVGLKGQGQPQVARTRGPKASASGQASQPSQPVAYEPPDDDEAEGYRLVGRAEPAALEPDGPKSDKSKLF
jgi:3'-5' exoribonuclease